MWSGDNQELARISGEDSKSIQATFSEDTLHCNYGREGIKVLLKIHTLKDESEAKHFAQNILSINEINALRAKKEYKVLSYSVHPADSYIVYQTPKRQGFPSNQQFNSVRIQDNIVIHAFTSPASKWPANRADPVSTLSNLLRCATESKTIDDEIAQGWGVEETTLDNIRGTLDNLFTKNEEGVPDDLVFERSSAGYEGDIFESRGGDERGTLRRISDDYILGYNRPLWPGEGYIERFEEAIRRFLGYTEEEQRMLEIIEATGARKCQKEPDFELCIKKLSQESGQPLLCENIQSRSKYCYAEYAVKNQDPSVCENIKNTYNREWCYWMIGDITTDESICQKQPVRYVDKCIHQNAWKNQDPAKCTKIKDPKTKDNCIFCIALKQKNTQLCEETIDKNKCLEQISEKRQCIKSARIQDAHEMSTVAGSRA